MASIYISVYAKFESFGLSRLGCKTLTRLYSVALILSTIFIEMGTAIEVDRPILKFLSFQQVANTLKNVCVKSESNEPRRLS